MILTEENMSSLEEGKKFKRLTKLYGKCSRKCVATYLDKSKQDVNEIFKVGSSTLHPFGWTALLCACRNLNLGVVDELLNRGANPNLTAYGGLSPLMAVAVASSKENSNESVACAKMLIEAGASIGKVPIFNNHTLLTRAIRNQASALVKFLLDFGADPNEKDGKGETPLNIAILTLQKDMAKILLHYSANPFINNADNKSSLDVAEGVAAQDREIMSLVLEWRLDFYEDFYKGKREEFCGMLDCVNSSNVPRFEFQKAEATKEENVLEVVKPVLKPALQTNTKAATKLQIPCDTYATPSKPFPNKVLSTTEVNSSRANDMLQQFLTENKNEVPRVVHRSPTNLWVGPETRTPSERSSARSFSSSTQTLPASPDNGELTRMTRYEKTNNWNGILYFAGTLLVSFSMFCYLKSMNRLKN